MVSGQRLRAAVLCYYTLDAILAQVQAPFACAAVLGRLLEIVGTSLHHFFLCRLTLTELWGNSTSDGSAIIFQRQRSFLSTNGRGGTSSSSRRTRRTKEQSA